MNSHPLSAFIGATVRLLPTAEGGRRAPISSGYRCNCWIGHTDVHGRTYNDATLYLIDTESLAPGDTAVARVRPHDPDAWYMLTEGSTFELCEGPRTVGVATVTDLFADTTSTRPDV